MTRLAAIIGALAETGGSPESMLYIFCGMDMQAWQAMRSVLVGSGLVGIKAHYVTLTEKGKTLAGKINAAISKGGV